MSTTKTSEKIEISRLLRFQFFTYSGLSAFFILFVVPIIQRPAGEQMTIKLLFRNWIPSALSAGLLTVSFALCYYWLHKKRLNAFENLELELAKQAEALK